MGRRVSSVIFVTVSEVSQVFPLKQAPPSSKWISRFLESLSRRTDIPAWEPSIHRVPSTGTQSHSSFVEVGKAEVALTIEVSSVVSSSHARIVSEKIRTIKTKICVVFLGIWFSLCRENGLRSGRLPVRVLAKCNWLNRMLCVKTISVVKPSFLTAGILPFPSSNVYR